MTNTAITRLLPAVAVVAALAASAPALAQDDHVLIPDGEFGYSAGPPSLPDGAEFAVLYGTPSEEGLFVMRLKLPDGYLIPPHTHPRPEVVTVISGTFEIGMGENPDRDAAQALPAGSFFAFPPGMTHYAYADGETVVQLNSTGPWEIEYVDTGDDPRIN
jgi:quercetin dioxygenase-like cupin family protein